MRLKFNNCFALLPVWCIIQERIFVVHGGPTVSPSVVLPPLLFLLPFSPLFRPAPPHLNCLHSAAIALRLCAASRPADLRFRLKLDYALDTWLLTNLSTGLPKDAPRTTIPALRHLQKVLEPAQESLFQDLLWSDPQVL